MKKLQSIIFCSSLALTLCSCASDGTYRSSFSVNGQTTPTTMDLNNPRFYMDERELAPVLSNPSSNANPSNIYCAPFCGY